MSDVLNLSQTAREGVDILRDVLTISKQDWNSTKEVPFNVILSHFESYCVRHSIHHRLERRCFQAMLLFTADTSMSWAERMECLPFYFKQLRKDQIIDVSDSMHISNSRWKERSVNVNDDDATSLAEYLNSSSKRVTFSPNESWSQSRIYPSTPTVPHSIPPPSQSALLPSRIPRRDIFLTHHSSAPANTPPAPFSSVVSPVPHTPHSVPSVSPNVYLSSAMEAPYPVEETAPSAAQSARSSSSSASIPTHDFSTPLKPSEGPSSELPNDPHDIDVHSRSYLQTRQQENAYSRSRSSSQSSIPDALSAVDSSAQNIIQSNETPSPRLLRGIKHAASQRQATRSTLSAASASDNVSPIASPPPPSSPPNTPCDPSSPSHRALSPFTPLSCDAAPLDSSHINPIASTLRLLILFQRYISNQPFSIVGSLRNPSPALHVHLSNVEIDTLSHQEAWLHAHISSFVRLQTIDIYFRSWKDTIYSVSLASSHFQYFGKRRGFAAFEESALLTRSRQHKTQWKCAWMWKIRMKMRLRRLRANMHKKHDKHRQNNAIADYFRAKMLRYYLKRWCGLLQQTIFQRQSMRDGKMQQLSLVISRLRRKTLIRKRYRLVRRIVLKRVCKNIWRSWHNAAIHHCKEILLRHQLVTEIYHRSLVANMWKQWCSKYEQHHSLTVRDSQRATAQWKLVKLVTGIRRWKQYHFNAVSYTNAIQEKCGNSVLSRIDIASTQVTGTRRKAPYDMVYLLIRCVRHWRRRTKQFIKVYTDLRTILYDANKRRSANGRCMLLRRDIVVKALRLTRPPDGVVYMYNPMDIESGREASLQLRVLPAKDIKHYKNNAKICQDNVHCRGCNVSYVRGLMYQWHVKAVERRWKRNKAAHLSKYFQLITAPPRAAVLHTPLFRRQLSRSDSVAISPSEYRWAVYCSYFRWKHRHVSMKPVREAVIQATRAMLRDKLVRWWSQTQTRKAYKISKRNRLLRILMEWKVLYFLRRSMHRHLERHYNKWKHMRIMTKYTSVWYKFLTQRDVRKGFNKWKYMTQVVLKCCRYNAEVRGMVAFNLWSNRSRETRQNMHTALTYHDYMRKQSGLLSLMEYTRVKQETRRQNIFLDEMVAFFALLNRLRTRVTNRQMEHMATQYHMKHGCRYALRSWRQSVRRRVLYREKVRHATVYCTTRGATIAFGLLSGIT